jgi:ABC-type uncharacterized transport system ATPase subunit
MPIVSVSHLRKEFAIFRHHRGACAAVRNLLTRERRVVNTVADVSVSIDRGELVGYLGTNGAGKSTTVKILAGILVPSGGDVSVNGRVPWRERQTCVAGFARNTPSASELTSRVSAQYRMLDLSVREPKIEATVRRIYQEELL